jgi:O-antigen ligase
MTARTDGAIRAGLGSLPLSRAGALGSLTLGLALLAVLFLPNGWLQVVLAALAALLLSLDRRLGPLPAAMLVMLAIPVGRGAEVALPEVAGNPVRPHDVVAAIGLIIGLAATIGRLHREGLAAVRRPTAVALLVFLAVGLGALVIGILSDNALRNVARDARWWILYAAGLLALLSGTSRPAIVRALVWGMTLYSALILLGMLMPDFEGGLKIGAYAYDPRMRLHYGQATFLIPAAAYAAYRATRRPIPWLFLAALFGAAAGLTLTRALMGGMVVVGAMAAVWATWAARGRLGGYLRYAAVPALALLIGLGGGLGTYSVGIRIWAPAPGQEPGASQQGPNGDQRPVINVMDRVTGGDRDDLTAQAGGRFYSYADAFIESRDAPVLGHGLGEMVRIGWAYGGYKSSTVGEQPGVDNAYLTVAIKAGAVGAAAIGALLLWPIRLFLARRRRRFWTWLLPAWLVILGLTLIESFAVSGYAPFTLSMLLVLPALGARRT